MEFLNALPAGLVRDIATIVFGCALAILAARSYFAAKNVTPPKTTPEFAFSGQLTDMNPVKKLVENTGLLVLEIAATNVKAQTLIDLFKTFLDAENKERAEVKKEEEFEQIARLVREKLAADQEEEKHKRTTRRET